MAQYSSRQQEFDAARSEYLERLKSSSPSKRLLESITAVEGALPAHEAPPDGVRRLRPRTVSPDRHAERG
ncbi:MAG: hypothetical protein U0Q15_01690 [Kineosporiaceae bacterium]